METETGVGESPVHRTGSHRHARRQRWYASPFLVIAAVTALGGAIRFYHLSNPHGTPRNPVYIFDEVYYAKDGCYDAGYPYAECHLQSPGEQTVTVHPPLGRELIAISEHLFGNRPFGWRFGSAVFGTLSILLISIVAYRLFASVLWAGVAGLLLATESLNFVQSRVSMLDIYLTAFVLAGFLFLVLDKEWIERRTPDLGPERPAEAAEPEGVFDQAPQDRPDRGPDRDEAFLLDFPPDRPPSPVLRPWRILAGLAFGAAVATKWSGGPALAGGIALALAWERTRRRRVGVFHPLAEAVRDEAFGIFLFLVLVPVAVYFASYTRWFVQNHWSLGGWWALQKSMASYSIHLRTPHPYASSAWKWLLLWRPVAYYYAGDAKLHTSAEILGIGNQVVFWGSLITLPYALIAWRRKRDWRAGLIVVAFVSQYAFWFFGSNTTLSEILSRHIPWLFAARTSFLFYMTPLTPFMVLAGVYALKDMSDARVGQEGTRPLAPIAVLLVLLAVAVFVFFYPVLVGRTISTTAWQARMWFKSWI